MLSTGSRVGRARMRSRDENLSMLLTDLLPRLARDAHVEVLNRDDVRKPLMAAFP